MGCRSCRAGGASRTGRAGRTDNSSPLLNNKLCGNIEKDKKCTQWHPHKSFQKTNRNVQVLPNQKTHQNVETFEHKWPWFLTAPRHEKL
jgi:hypothetical protein